MKKGFTLAETVITVAIIGILAGIALPIMQRSTPNHEMIMFQKAYYLASRAISELINDDALYPDKASESESGFANTDNVKYQGVFIYDAGQSNSSNAQRKFCVLLALKMNATCSADNIINTADGLVWNIPNTTFSSAQNPTIISVNVNNHNQSLCDDDGGAKQCVPERFFIRVYRDGLTEVAANTYARRYLSEKNKTKKHKDFTF